METNQRLLVASVENALNLGVCLGSIGMSLSTGLRPAPVNHAGVAAVWRQRRVPRAAAGLQVGGLHGATASDRNSSLLTPL